MQDEPEDMEGITPLRAKMDLEQIRRPMNLPRFLTFKKDLNTFLLEGVKSYNAAMKGKTLGNQLSEMVAKDTILAGDPEVQALQIEAQVAKADALCKQVKEFAERTVTLWRFQVTKQETWRKTVADIVEKCDELAESIEEINQTLQVVKEVKLGLKRVASAKKRQHNHAKLKRVKQMVATGMQAGLAELLAKFGASAIDDGLGAHGSLWNVVDFSLPFLLANGASDKASVAVQTLYTKHIDAFASEAMKLIPTMKTTSIMKPLKLDTSLADDLCDADMGIEKGSHAWRPWLLVAAKLSNSWGTLRWPFPGFPAFVTALDSFIVLVLVPLERLMAKGVSQETPEWFSDGSDESAATKLVEDDVHTMAMEKGQTIFVPMGHLVLWSFFPTCDKASHGKIMVQHLYKKEPEVTDIVAKEMELSVAKVMSSYGKSKPWSDLKEDIEKWMTSWKQVRGTT